jgi:hypothetical protein
MNKNDQLTIVICRRTSSLHISSLSVDWNIDHCSTELHTTLMIYRSAATGGGGVVVLLVDGVRFNLDDAARDTFGRSPLHAFECFSTRSGSNRRSHSIARPATTFE